MKKLSFLVSRPFLVLLALVVISLVIWFVGPFVAFGGLKPFAGASMRVLSIALLCGAALLWLANCSISAVFVALLCLLIWYAAPLLSFGLVAPFAPVAARTIAIACVIALFAAYWIFRLWQRMRSDEQFLRRALAFGGKKAESLAAGRLTDVETRTARALARLKAMRTEGRGLGQLFQRTRYLYELPWYITLGATASGKTGALLNAGLPLAPDAQMRRADGAGAATKNVDWWLADNAVLIDTAGYYTRHGASSQAQSTPNGSDAADGNTTAGSAAHTRANLAANRPAATATLAPAGDSNAADAQRRTDEAEWLGFLQLLRKHRPHAPINGALVAVDLATLASQDANALATEAASLRARLVELRTRLGIRFPVYLLITRMDRLTGFAEYFRSLTGESRAQIWGFTLPHGNEAIMRNALSVRCDEELELLATRLADGVNTRLEDEYDPYQRRRLAALPEAFAALTGPLGELIEQVFVDSRYDDTQRHATLRGVYFASAMQDDKEIAVERHTIAQRIAPDPDSACATRIKRQPGSDGYFLHDLFTKVMFPEAHLVRPNLRWEYRLRLLRLLGHAFAILVFVWLALGLRASFGNNSGYLDAVAHKTQTLTAKVASLYSEQKTETVPDALDDARYLATYPGLDLSAPDSIFRYGLFAAREVSAESLHTYRALESNLLLPQIVRRLEEVIEQATANRDPKATYDALRVYLMLYDRAKFNADDIKAWVLDDWARTDSASIFGGRASMIAHVQQLFSGAWIVQSPLIRNDALVQQARSFLDGSNAIQRLYERAKAALQKQAPDEFTLLRAVGPQAGTVFTRASSAPLARGVPGLFTFDGYHNLFNKRLPEFIEAAREDDAWVMGRSYLAGLSETAQKKTAEIAAAAAGGNDPLTEAIRRQYLTEYAQRWDAFLGDIRTVSGTSLAFDLQILRSFAAPDSPLVRLARAAVRETTLVQPIDAADDSPLRKAGTQLGRKADEALGMRFDERLEREVVDSRFAALREMTTGHADALAASGQPSSAQTGKTGLDSMAGLLNDYYTALMVADNAIANHSMPPASDAAAKLKITANTLPAPFREVLLELGSQGSREVNRGIGQLLSRQMQAVVGDTCRLTVAGNYPFEPDGKRDVSVDDFTRVFAQGGVIDDFFTKNLAPFVDTSATPWRYRTLAGSTEPVQGPDLEPFQHAQAIRAVFFDAPGQKQLTWKADVRVSELDPAITGLMIDIDGQTLLYQHGPVTPFAVNWPGPRGGGRAELTASPRIRPDTSTVATDGPWALMRLLHKGQMVETATAGRTRVTFDFDGRKAVLDIASAGSVANPLTSNVLKTFRCPSSMPMFGLADTGPPPGLPAAFSAPAASPTAVN